MKEMQIKAAAKEAIATMFKEGIEGLEFVEVKPNDTIAIFVEVPLGDGQVQPLWVEAKLTAKNYIEGKAGARGVVLDAYDPRAEKEALEEDKRVKAINAEKRKAAKAAEKAAKEK